MFTPVGTATGAQSFKPNPSGLAGDGEASMAARSAAAAD
jgi:hypothetical protein